MQSANVLPPPPGALGAAWLGLPGRSAREPLLSWRALPPPDVTGAWVCGESGATPFCSGEGWVGLDGVVAPGVDCSDPLCVLPGVGGLVAVPGVCPGMVDGAEGAAVDGAVTPGLVVPGPDEGAVGAVMRGAGAAGPERAPLVPEPPLPEPPEPELLCA